MTDTQKGTVSVSREWLSDLQTFLEEAYDGGIEGLIQEECGNQLVELRAILAQPAEQQDEPACYINPDHLDRRMDGTANGSTSCVIFNDSHGGCLTPLHLRPAAQVVKLPGRKRESCEDSDVLADASNEGWNACLDAVAKLNGIEP